MHTAGILNTCGQLVNFPVPNHWLYQWLIVNWSLDPKKVNQVSSSRDPWSGCLSKRPFQGWIFVLPPFRGSKDWKKLEVPIIFQLLLSASYKITRFKSPSYMIFPMIFVGSRMGRKKIDEAPIQSLTGIAQIVRISPKFGFGLSEGNLGPRGICAPPCILNCL